MAEAQEEKTQGMVVGRLLCIQCRYDLRGCGMNEDCPECGVPVRVTVSGDDLAGADIQWLKVLRKGVRAMVFFWWGVLGTVLVVMLAAVGLTALQYLEAPVEWNKMFGVGVVWLWLFALGCILVWATERLSAEEPGRAFVRANDRWRKRLARVRLVLLGLRVLEVCWVVAFAWYLDESEIVLAAINMLLGLKLLVEPTAVCAANIVMADAGSRMNDGVVRPMMKVVVVTSKITAAASVLMVLGVGGTGMLFGATKSGLMAVAFCGSFVLVVPVTGISLFLTMVLSLSGASDMWQRLGKLIGKIEGERAGNAGVAVGGEGLVEGGMEDVGEGKERGGDGGG